MYINFFQVSFILKVILKVSKVTQNTMTELKHFTFAVCNPSQSFKSLFLFPLLFPRCYSTSVYYTYWGLIPWEVRLADRYNTEMVDNWTLSHFNFLISYRQSLIQTFMFFRTQFCLFIYSDTYTSHVDQNAIKSLSMLEFNFPR